MPAGGTTAGSWLPAGAWQACVGEPTFTDGEPIWVGVDVGGERSASAVVWINANLHVGAAIYYGDAAIYQGDAGVLECADQIRELAGRYRLRGSSSTRGGSGRPRRNLSANASA